jgi:L,D-transpeptidase catalytic domain
MPGPCQLCSCLARKSYRFALGICQLWWESIKFGARTEPTDQTVKSLDNVVTKTHGRIILAVPGQWRSSFTLRCHEHAVSALIHSRNKMGFIRAALLAALAVYVLPVGTTRAQARFWPEYGHWWGNNFSPRYKHHHPHAKSDLAKKVEPQGTLKGPLQIIISITAQQLSLYDNGELIARAPVSTGIRGHPTPLGLFNVISKERWHRSNLYSAAPMPYMQRITWSGIALHAGVLPGHPASHGCIRLPNDFAYRLYQLTKRGTRVIIARDDVKPVEIANPHLLVLQPKMAPVSSEPQAVVGNSVTTAVAANKPSLANEVEFPEAANSPLPASSSGRVAHQKVVPISVFVSGKLSRLFVRQHFTPLFDAPVKIQNPELPLGTHVFTAMEFQNDGAPIRWTVVSLPEEHPGSSGNKQAFEVPLTENATAALDRIEIPQEVVEQISELITPGASVTLSDYGISRETGRDTDFIVLTH